MKKSDGFFVQFERLFGSRPGRLKSNSWSLLAQRRIACAKGLFAGEAGLVGFFVVWTREKLVFISLEGFLLSLGFLDFKGSQCGQISRGSVESLCLVFVRMESTPTARGETRERSLDGSKRRRRRPTAKTESQTT